MESGRAVNVALWTAVTSWFTPTILFCFINLMVATIYVSSSVKNQKKQEPKQPGDNPVQLFRILERVKSTNFSRFRAAEQSQTETQYVEQSEEHVVIDQGHVQSMDDDEEHLVKTKSLTAPMRKSQAKMKKSESVKMGRTTEWVVSDEVEFRRPETAREKKAKWVGDDDEAVDSKADDFISKFRQQLKLQRLDSMIRNSSVAH